ncbi:hypothetical protein [Rariglobus hedericola]|uniref:Uncharacterized protein n=1 Tax=Rariglobus hedericola TaxID=2597822 RepID=A0A556QJR7_9BACT|nr:hypothetical protein [Rariglobus hedericola]TSJ76894.1 hypothetical protein FPL22_12310 [Rariglobus hedericola]
MKKWLVLILLGAGCWYWWHEPAADWRGLPASSDPIQITTGLPPPFTLDDNTVTPLARYEIKAVVLSRKRYRYDKPAKIGPVDLALGWGPMSAAGVINELNISQSGRWYEYTWAGDPPLEPQAIAEHSANTHCLPATPAIRKQLLAVKRHDVVTLKGYLIEVTGPQGERWRSSLSRSDTRGGACEVMWITELSTTRAPR